MIDWIKAVIPLEHSASIGGGELFCINHDTGDVEWSCIKRRAIEGTHETRVHVKTYDEGFLLVDGNPTKFLQGHNIFGSNDLRAVVFEFLVQVAGVLGIKPTPENLNDWRRGNYEIKTVDVTESFRLPRQQDVVAWLRAGSKIARGKRQSASSYSGETLYIGQNSRRISTKIYSKYSEICRNKLPRTLPLRSELTEFAKGLLRFEVRLHSMELKRRDLNKAENWSLSTPYEILQERIMNMKLNQKFRLSASELRELPPRLQLVYSSWVNGEDLRGILSKSSYYRYRAELLEHGVDITAPRPEPGDVIPLLHYLTAEHISQIPEEIERNNVICFRPPRAS